MLGFNPLGQHALGVVNGFSGGVGAAPAGTGGWGAGLGWPIKPLSERKRPREYVEAENRRVKEIEALERAFEKAWLEVFPPPPVEIEREPEVQWPALSPEDIAAARLKVQESERARAAVQAMLEAVNRAIAEKKRIQQDEDDAEALLLLLSAR